MTIHWYIYILYILYIYILIYKKSSYIREHSELLRTGKDGVWTREIIKERTKKITGINYYCVCESRLQIIISLNLIKYEHPKI